MGYLTQMKLMAKKILSVNITTIFILSWTLPQNIVNIINYCYKDLCTGEFVIFGNIPMFCAFVSNLIMFYLEEYKLDKFK